jgi:hypothetical protein
MSQPLFTLGERATTTSCTGIWVGPKESLDVLGKRKSLISSGIQTLDHPAHTECSITAAINYMRCLEIRYI